MQENLYAVCRVNLKSRERSFSALVPIIDEALEMSTEELAPLIFQSLKASFRDMTRAEVIEFVNVPFALTVSQIYSAMEEN